MTATSGGGTASETESCGTLIGTEMSNPYPPCCCFRRCSRISCPCPGVVVKFPFPNSRGGLRTVMMDLMASNLALRSLSLINLPYNRLGPVPVIVSLPLGRPQALPKIFLLPQQGIDPPFHLNGRLFLLPLYLPVVPIFDQFAALGLVDGGVNLFPKIVPCLLQLSVRPLP